MTAQVALPLSPARSYTQPRNLPIKLTAFAIAAFLHALLLVPGHRPPAPVATPVTVLDEPTPPIPPIAPEEIEKDEAAVNTKSAESAPSSIERIEVPAPGVPVQRPDIRPNQGSITPGVMVIPSDVGPGIGQGEPIVDFKTLDRRPEAISRAAPNFPAALRGTVSEAVVRATFLVHTDGKVSDIRILKSSHHGFEDAVERALSRWKFRPGWKNNHPVTTRMEQEVVFRLEN